MTDGSETASADSPHAARQGLSREQRRQLAAENKRDWLAFPELHGSHLTWHKEGSGSWELRASGGDVWATRHGRSVTANGKSYEVRDVWEGGKRPRLSGRWERKELVDSAGAVELSWTGTHFKGNARTILTLGDVDYAFPVRGSAYDAKTVMSAIAADGSSRSLARFRLTCGWYRAALSSMSGTLRPVEVVVLTDSLPTLQMALIIAVASPWLLSYFQKGGA